MYLRMSLEGFSLAGYSNKSVSSCSHFYECQLLKLLCLSGPIEESRTLHDFGHGIKRFHPGDDSTVERVVSPGTEPITE